MEEAMKGASARSQADLGHLDYLWWLIGLIGGPVVVLLPDYVFPSETHGVRLLLTCATLFLLGGLMGCMAPNRPWRWGIACILLLPALDAYKALANPANFKFDEFFAQLQLTVPNFTMYGFYGILVVVGAYIGANTCQHS